MFSNVVHIDFGYEVVVCGVEYLFALRRERICVCGPKSWDTRWIESNWNLGMYSSVCVHGLHYK